MRELAPGRVLVVGHSNTVPAIIRHSAARMSDEIPTAYANLFVVISEDGA
jgi:hypothetical protein